MLPSDDRILTIISVAFLFVLAIWTVQPRLARHDDTLTIIQCRFGERHQPLARWPHGDLVARR